MPRPKKVHLTPYKIKAGTRYKLRWHANGSDQEERGFMDEDRAKVRRNEIETQLLQGQAPMSSVGTASLSEFAEFHFATATHLAPNTVMGYRKVTKHNIDAPITYRDPMDEHRTKTICLGRMQLKKVTYEVVEEWVLAVEQVRGASQRAKAYRCLSGIMSRALKLGEISTHPCKVRGASKERIKPRPPVDEETPWLLAQALRKHTDAYGRHNWDRFAAIPIFIAYGTGNRKSEFRALRRRDITFDLDKATIRVERTAYWVDAKTGWVTDAPTKSESGQRPITIYAAALEALRDHMDTYMRPDSEDPDGEDLVFTGLHGGPVSDTSWQDAWTYARKVVGVEKMTLHDLRHHAATSLAKDIKDLKHIQTFLGDSTVVAAMRYLAVTDEAIDEMGQAMGRRFAKYRKETTDADVLPIRRAR